MTPPEFVTRCEAAIEDLALLYAHTPDEAINRSLDRVLTNIEAGWLQTFKGFATPEDIAGVVADLGRRIQTRRREIEAAGGGTA